MKANELRLGNLVYTKGEDIVIVNEINNDGINGEFDLCWASHFFENESIQPIPLTEEWLVKFGFKKGSKGWFKTLSNNHKFNFYMYKNLCSNVHQLQNLYFALTGEELTIG